MGLAGKGTILKIDLRRIESSEPNKRALLRGNKRLSDTLICRPAILEEQQKISLMKLSALSWAFKVIFTTIVKHCGVRVVNCFLVYVCVCVCAQEMKDQLSSPSAVAQAEKKNRQALLTSSGQDRSSGLEAHMVSANSRYIQEQQEQQQVERDGELMNGIKERENVQESGRVRSCLWV